MSFELAFHLRTLRAGSKCSMQPFNLIARRRSFASSTNISSGLIYNNMGVASVGRAKAKAGASGSLSRQGSQVNVNNQILGGGRV